jgi:hypothetical protein
MKALADGESPDLSAQEDYHAANDAFVARRRERGLAEELAEFQAARADWAAWLAELPEEDFFQSRTYAGEDWSFFGGQLEIMWRHDAMHAKEIAAWSVSGQWAGKTGPSSVLLAALNAARHELLACAALVPASERASRMVCGAWTLKDVLGHIADWEQIGVQGLRDMVAGKAPQVEFIDDIDAWNQVHAGLRRDQPWEEVWADLHAVRSALLETLNGTIQTTLDSSFRFPWGAQGTAYQWLTVFAGHDQEHAQDLLPEMRV